MLEQWTCLSCQRPQVLRGIRDKLWVSRKKGNEIWEKERGDGGMEGWGESDHFYLLTYTLFLDFIWFTLAAVKYSKNIQSFLEPFSLTLMLNFTSSRKDVKEDLGKENCSGLTALAQMLNGTSLWMLLLQGVVGQHYLLSFSEGWFREFYQIFIMAAA